MGASFSNLIPFRYIQDKQLKNKGANQCLAIENGKLKLGKLGDIPILYHRFMFKAFLD